MNIDYKKNKFNTGSENISGKGFTNVVEMPVLCVSASKSGACGGEEGRWGEYCGGCCEDSKGVVSVEFLSSPMTQLF